MRPGHVHLAEEHQPLAFAVFHQRAVLQAVAAVEDRQEVAAGGLLDQDRGDVAAVAAAPDARHVDAAPLDRRRRRTAGSVVVLSGAAAEASPRRASRAGSPPSSPASSGWSGTRWKTCRRPYSATRNPSRFSRTSAVCSKTMTFSPSRTRPRSGPGPSDGQRLLADDQQVVAREVGVGVHRLRLDAHRRPAAWRSRPWGRRARSSRRSARVGSGPAGR